jgi:hypothetical protein
MQSRLGHNNAVCWALRFGESVRELCSLRLLMSFFEVIVHCI